MQKTALSSLPPIQHIYDNAFYFGSFELFFSSSWFLKDLKTPTPWHNESAKISILANGEIVVVLYEATDSFEDQLEHENSRATTLAGNKNSLTEKLQSLKK